MASAASNVTPLKPLPGCGAVYGKIAAVQGALAKVGIAKDRRNSGQGYNFRGIDDVYAALSPLLAQYGSYETGFTSYDEVTEAQRKELSDQVNALAEPLSQLTHTVLGVAK